MKEMIYKSESDIEILMQDSYFEYDFVIVSYGTHPCAYVKLPENHPYYGKEYDDMKIRVHGGLTYKGELTHVFQKDIGVFIGWDYAHPGDYMGYEGIFGSFGEQNKKWTTEEIFEEVKSVIAQLIEAFPPETGINFTEEEKTMLKAIFAGADAVFNHCDVNKADTLTSIKQKLGIYDLLEGEN